MTKYIYVPHPDHFPPPIFDTFFSVKSLLFLDYLPLFSHKTSWEK